MMLYFFKQFTTHNITKQLYDNLFSKKEVAIKKRCYILVACWKSIVHNNTKSNDNYYDTHDILVPHNATKELSRK